MFFLWNDPADPLAGFLADDFRLPDFVFAHDLIRKPESTFRDHAVANAILHRLSTDFGCAPAADNRAIRVTSSRREWFFRAALVLK
jgi:hypothetical protein